MRSVPPTSLRLAVEGLVKTFGELPVLADVDLVVEPGSSVALLGPSGCGKTTLLRAIAGLERVEGGRITLGETVVTGPGVHVPPERRRIGMVFQDWALFPHLDVAANIAYGLERDGRRRARVDEVLEMVGLEGFGDRMPATLSGGQQQRVAIARAIAPRPAAILLDEPFSNLDASLRLQVRSDTQRLLRDIGMTTLFVTHDQAEAFVMGDEVAVMSDGVIRQQASPAALYARPSDPWVASFVGEANLLPVSVEGAQARSAIGPLPIDTAAPGDRTVLVRPEQLRLEPGGDGEVVSVEFYGHDTSYRVTLTGGVELIVRAIAGPRFSAGDKVAVVYDGPPAHAFVAEGQPAAV